MQWKIKIVLLHEFIDPYNPNWILGEIEVTSCWSRSFNINLTLIFSKPFLYNLDSFETSEKKVVSNAVIGVVKACKQYPGLTMDRHVGTLLHRYAYTCVVWLSLDKWNIPTTSQKNVVRNCKFIFIGWKGCNELNGNRRITCKTNSCLEAAWDGVNNAW